MMPITKEMMKAWAENYEEAIDTLMWVANDGYDQDDLVEAIETYFDEQLSDD
ncbi:MAG: hypothetical protein HN646_00825 [Nitrospina sp.]|jgi:hypothetical protein|nr:hypothetical protein [Nitrospina sp.]